MALERVWGRAVAMVGEAGVGKVTGSLNLQMAKAKCIGECGQCQRKLKFCSKLS